MPAKNPDLYQRLLAFPLDEGTPDLSFERRLARENDWDISYTRRVLAEYRRFLYLAMTAGHTVSPSEQVDQAWHLHLTYTRSYWDRLCGELLGCPLHHSPTRGGAEESAKYRDLYSLTLDSYRREFGVEPPADIWPPSGVRFGDDLRFVRVNKTRNWIVPKFLVRRSLVVGAVVGCGLVSVTGCSGKLGNPFDLPGTDFIYFLVPVFLMAVILGSLVRHRLQGPGPQQEDAAPDLDWEDVAYLAGGRHRLTTAAIARLVAADVARVSVDHKVLEAAGSGSSPPQLSSVEAVVFHSLPLNRDDRESLKSVSRQVDDVFADRATELAEAGYLLSPARRFASGIAMGVPIAAVIVLLIIPRLVHGILTAKPSGFLLFTMIVSVLILLHVLQHSFNRLSRRGKFVLDRLRGTTHSICLSSSGPETVGSSVGLNGTASLSDCEVVNLVELATWYPHQSGHVSDGSFGSGCGTATAGDGGGCGGGGCGGGGCGGGCGGCGG